MRFVLELTMGAVTRLVLATRAPTPSLPPLISGPPRQPPKQTPRRHLCRNYGHHLARLRRTRCRCSALQLGGRYERDMPRELI